MFNKHVRFNWKKTRKDILNIMDVFKGRDGALIILASTISAVVSVSLTQDYTTKKLIEFILKAFLLSGIIWFGFYLFFVIYCFWSNLSDYLIEKIWPKNK